MTLPNAKISNETSTASFDDVVRSLQRPSAFPKPIEDVQLRQTHISAVFLAGDVVYKLKKPVKLPFLDFSTAALRQHFCHEEVRINSPWAPGVYLGVVSVTKQIDGFCFEGDGPVVDWAVNMRRLPESVTLRSRLTDGTLEASDLRRIARRIAEIHRDAAHADTEQSKKAVTAFVRQLNDNWEFASRLPATVIAPQVLERIRTLSNALLASCGALLETRRENGMIRDVHGDLRLEHVFFFPNHSSPDDIVILDGIEFDPELRCTDVTADIAFLTMELSFAGRRDLAEVFADEYFVKATDPAGWKVLPLFAVYRSAVRAKVAAILGGESEVPKSDREKAQARSRSHWLWCLSELESPDRRPALILVSGLPGTGKSTLSRSLADKAHFEVIRSDVVRKEIFASEMSSESTAPLYSSDRTQLVYNECLERARKSLLVGGRVIVDATFQREENRQAFLELAIACGCRAVWLECVAPAEITKQRIDSRHGDASDADWSVYQLVKERWEQPSAFTQRFHAIVETGHSSEPAADDAIVVLQNSGLATPSAATCNPNTNK